MSYSPLQARGRDGKWVAKGGNAAFRTIKKTASVGAGKKVKSPVKSHGKSTARNSGVVPYARVNKRSSTVGFNAGAVIPRTKKRVVVGGYARVESTTRHTTADKIAGKAVSKVIPKGSRVGKGLAYARKNIGVNNPALRATTPKGNSVRLGTSRSAGPTIIVRKGSHKVAQPKSALGVQRYDTRTRAVAGKRAGKVKKRPQRRRASRKK